MVNIDPPEDLPEHWHSDFRGEYRECIIEKFESFDEESKRRNFRQEVTKQKEHRKLINFCIFPFTQSNPPGNYRFIRADPLQELGVKNFDFLLYDFDGHAIFGEVKANLPQNVDRIINEVDEQRQLIEENLDYIVDRYIGEEDLFVEYVAATFSNQSNDLTRRILSQGEDIITWEVNRFDKEIQVNTEMPEEWPDNLEGETPDEQLQELRRRTEHSVSELNSAISGISTSDGAYDIFYCSGPVDRMRTIISACTTEGRYTYVNRIDIREVVQENLQNAKPEGIEDLVDRIIQNGKEIGFLQDWDDERGQMKVVSRYAESDGLEETLKKKWVNYKIEEIRDEFREECFTQATDEVGRQAQIGDFEEAS